MLAEYAPDRGRDTLDAVLATFTIATRREESRALSRSSGSNSPVSRTWRLEVEPHVAFDVLPTALREAPAPRSSSVVDEQIEPAMLSLYGLAHARRRVLREQIDRHHRRSAKLVCQIAQPVLPPGNEH